MQIPEGWAAQPLHERLAEEDSGAATRVALIQVGQAQTGSYPALLFASNLDYYWCKWPGNPHGNQSLVHELVVAGLGSLIGAPTPEGVLIEVDAHLAASIRSADGTKARAGVWFGLGMVDGTERVAIQGQYRGQENRRRLARYLALWELCLGGDAQFMYEESRGHRMWSIDHGLWFDGEQGPWERKQLPLLNAVGWADPPWVGSSKVDQEELLAAADAVEGITSSHLGDILGNVPIGWAIPAEDLDALGELVFDRRLLVADRLRGRHDEQASRRTRTRRVT